MAKDEADASTKDLVAEINKSKNYDYTNSKRQAKRTEKIKSVGLAQRKVIGHPEDFDKIHAYAKRLYENRGISLDND